ncbi:MAG TPA: hypothetical protein VFF67_09925 [Thermoplasmata archaeon]|nr:hypothetical protein [Thermoplasmata archaeon]
MSGVTLDRWSADPDFQPAELPRLTDSILTFARTRGTLGFTAEEFRSGHGGDPHVVAAAIGSLRSHGQLWILRREPSQHREAKGRWVSRFVPRDETRAWVDRV